ncbi:MAG: 4Fe-4S binding protein [Candidatus Diapherotrites archaeon]|nr:4Fe-4S binding protein [Candidatus Diapherotrites archaeon]
MKVSIAGIISEPGNSTENKTGDWRTFRPVVDLKKCKKCGICAKFCPDSAITVSKEKGAEIDYDYCKGCMICMHECPFNAITQEDEEK